MDILLDNESSDSDFDSSSSDDEVLNDIFEAYRLPQDRKTVKNFVENVVPSYSEKEFVRHFRIGSSKYYIN